MREFDRRFLFVVVLAVLATVAGCQTAVRTDSLVGTFYPVVDRHDDYARERLVDTELEEALAETSRVRATFEANRGGYLPEPFGGWLMPILDRHDAWVSEDDEISELARDVYLDSSRALRLVFEEPVAR